VIETLFLRSTNDRYSQLVIALVDIRVLPRRFNLLVECFLGAIVRLGAIRPTWRWEIGDSCT